MNQSAFMRRVSHTPSRFNPSSLTAAEYAQRAVETAKRNRSNEFVFIDFCRFAYSLVYTRAMRLEDAAYTESALWG